MIALSIRQPWAELFKGKGVKSAFDPGKTIRDKNLNNRRVSKLIKYDRKIKKQIGKIQDSINKGQRQT